ncbi:MAG: ComEC/Rec2 family competence protein [Patescibacteria group bacterium]
MIRRLTFFRKHWSFFFFIFLLAANIFVWLIIVRAERAVLTVAFLDVGQGDAIFIEAPGGNQVLVDAGRGRQVLRALGPLMPFYDRSIDLIVATHPDADHIGGFPEVLKRYAVGFILDTGLAAETAVDRAFRQAATAEEAEIIAARRGTRIFLGAGAVLEVLFPDRDPTGWETNTASIVARLTYGNREFLLTGDSPVKIEKYLVNLANRSLSADVLKVGHHGSKTSSAAEFLAAVAPEYAVISAGKNNRYGHPHESVLAALQKINAKILRTDEFGSIIFQTDGATLNQCPC